MGWIQRILGRKPDRSAALLPLYEQVVARARQPHWYQEGAVPDTMDGRFDMVAALLSLVLLRLEDSDDARQESVWLTELFVTDMDGQLRQLGVGDVSVGKHMGKIMSALGGRLGAYRRAMAGEGSMETAIRRNIFRDEAAPCGGVAYMETAMRRHAQLLSELATPTLLGGSATW